VVVVDLLGMAVMIVDLLVVDIFVVVALDEESFVGGGGCIN